MAPSPTGQDLHIGNVYAALINFAFAKKNQGKFIIRIEDTDRKRLVEGSEDRILDSFEWFGLAADESVRKGGEYAPYRQSERLEIYKKYAEELVEKDHAYYCDCTSERLEMIRNEQQKKGLPTGYDGHCRSINQKLNIKNKNSTNYVTRLKVPKEGITSFYDVIRGKISVENKLIDDQVLLKSDGYPTYHLGVVVDDHLMNITHVIRAEEWISSTPKHILLYKAFGWKMPIFAHIPILRNPDKSKLSKRRNPVWASWYKEQGFLPEAILNYLALMAWSMPDGREIFTLDEYMNAFTLERVTTTGPVFDLEKLKWMNSQYLNKLQVTSYELRVINYLKQYNTSFPGNLGSIQIQKLIEQTIPLIQTRIRMLSEYYPMCEFFFVAPSKYEKEVNREWLKRVLEVLESPPEADQPMAEMESMSQWEHKEMYEELSKLAEKLQVTKSKLFMDIRIAITGKKIGPPLFESMEILGKTECIKRIKNVIGNQYSVFSKEEKYNGKVEDI